MEKLEAEPPTVNETQSDAKWNEPKPDNKKGTSAASHATFKPSRKSVFVVHRARHKIYV